MKRKFKLFICMVMLVCSFSTILYKPLEVKAAPIAVEWGAVEVTKLIAWLIASGFISVGAYEVYENKDALNDAIDFYMTTNANGLLHPTYEYDESTGSLYISGTTITMDEYFSAVQDWDWGSSWGDDVIESPPWSKHPTEVRNPYTGEWEEVGSFDVLFPWEQELYGVDKPCVLPWDKDTIGQIQDWWSNHTAEDYRNAKEQYGGGGSGGGSDNNGNNKNNWTKYLDASTVDTLAKIGGATALTVSTFIEDLMNGDTDTTNYSYLEDMLNKYGEPTYSGELEYVNGAYMVRVHGNYTYVKEQEVYAYYSIDERPFLMMTADGGLLSACYCNDDKIGTTKFKGTRTYNGSTYEINSYSIGSTPVTDAVWSANCPIFLATDTASIQDYIVNENDSGCVNKDKKLYFTPTDIVGMAQGLPTTFSALALPDNEAISSTALQEYVDTMIDYKNSADYVPNTDTQTQVATQTMEDIVNKHKTTVDTGTDEEEKPLVAPLPSFPNAETITLDGSEATRDWRLVFPFCIPFDIIDLFRTLQAEREAPYWEIPLSLPAYGIEYTFIIDFEQFESVAKVLRTCELFAFILALCVLTGKVIKW